MKNKNLFLLIACAYSLILYAGSGMSSQKCQQPMTKRQRNNFSARFLDSIKNQDDLQVLLQLGDKNLNINAQDNEGNTGLILAAEYDHSIISFLLEYDTDVNMTNKKGESALIKAAQKNNHAIIKKLLEHDADTTIIDTAGKAARDYAKGKSQRLIKAYEANIASTMGTAFNQLHETASINISQDAENIIKSFISG